MALSEKIIQYDKNIMFPSESFKMTEANYSVWTYFSSLGVGVLSILVGSKKFGSSGNDETGFMALIPDVLKGKTLYMQSVLCNINGVKKGDFCYISQKGADSSYVKFNITTQTKNNGVLKTTNATLDDIDFDFTCNAQIPFTVE